MEITHFLVENVSIVFQYIKELNLTKRWCDDSNLSGQSPATVDILFD